MTFLIQIILVIVFYSFSIRAVLIAKRKQPSKKITKNLVVQTSIMFLWSFRTFLNPFFVSMFLYCFVLCLIVVFKKNFELSKVWIALLLLPIIFLTIILGIMIIVLSVDSL